MSQRAALGADEMFEYTAEQRVLEIGNTKIGGKPGINPTVLIGSIFYSGDKLVKNAKEGTIDVPSAEALLNALVDVSSATGLPSMLDVVAESSKAIETHLRYLVDITDMPLLVDGSGSEEVNLAGIQAAREGGFLDRVMLNSITPDTSMETLETFHELGVKHAVGLTFSNAAMASSTKRLDLAKMLLDKAAKAGIENVIIDTGVIDLLTLGLACKAQNMIKDKFGVPVGCGAHNAVSTWRGLVPKFGKDAKKPAFVGSSLMPVTLGADFVLYGPIKHAPIVFPSVAMIDVALSGVLLETRTRVDRPHPRYRIA